MARRSNALFPDPQEQDDASDVTTDSAPAIDSGDDMKGSEELFEQLKSSALEDWEHKASWRDEARIYYDMYANKQWSEEDRQILENQLRPVITFNRIAPVVDSLIGMELNDRKQVQYYPRTLGDAAINELYSSAAMYVREQSDAEDEESDAFLDLSICGEGWTDTHLTTDDGEGGELNIKIDRVDSLEMAADKHSKKRNYADARRLCRVRDIPITAAREMFPDHEDHELHAAWISGGTSQELVDTPKKYLFHDSKASDVYKGRKMVTIVEVQWWEKRDFWKVLDPMVQMQRQAAIAQGLPVGPESEDQITHFSDKDYKVAVKRWDELSKRMFQLTGQSLPPIQAARYKRKVYRRAFLGSVILKIAPLPYPYGFSYNCMTGKRDRNKGHWFGLIRAMKDPQEWANKWLSQILHIINSNAKGGLIARKTDFEDFRAVEQNWSRPDFIAWLAPGKTKADIGQRDPVQFPAGLYQLMDFAISSIRDANGFNLELMGLADREQAASLEYQRRQSGMTVLAQFFNSLRHYRKKQGRAMLYMIQKWLGDGRLIRITTDQGQQQYVQLLSNADEKVLEYDVAVDEVAASPNQKEMVWSMMLKAMPFLQGINLPGQVWADIIKYSPLPDSLATKIGQALNVPPDQAQEAFANTMQQLTLALAKANVQLTQTEAAQNVADARGKAAKAEKDIADAAKTAMETDAQRIAYLEDTVRRLTANAGAAMQPAPTALPQPLPTQSPFEGVPA